MFLHFAVSRSVLLCQSSPGDKQCGVLLGTKDAISTPGEEIAPGTGSTRGPVMVREEKAPNTSEWRHEEGTPPSQACAEGALALRAWERRTNHKEL